MELTLKSTGDFRIPLRMDKVKVEVVDLTHKGAKVRLPGMKTIRSINPEIDTYERIPLKELKEQLKKAQ